MSLAVALVEASACVSPFLAFTSPATFNLIGAEAALEINASRAAYSFFTLAAFADAESFFLSFAASFVSFFSLLLSAAGLAAGAPSASASAKVLEFSYWSAKVR